MSVCLTLRFLWEFLLPITFWTVHVLYLTSITVSMLFFNFYLCSIYLFWNFRKRNTVTQSLEHEWMKVNDTAFKYFLKSHLNKFCIIISLMLKSAAARFEAFTFLVKISNSPMWVTYVFSLMVLLDSMSDQINTSSWFLLSILTLLLENANYFA